MTTAAKPTVGRIIEVTSNRWEGKRPAIIVAVGESPDARPVRANVFLDGETDADALHSFRGDEHGNTVTLELGVQNPREILPNPALGRDWFLGWWMPFQVGQVPASLAVQGDLTGLKETADRLKDALGFLAQKLNKSSPDHPRANLYSGVMRILDGKDAEQPDAAQPAPPEPVTQTSTA
jgi:hypothetical protein